MKRRDGLFVEELNPSLLRITGDYFALRLSLYFENFAGFFFFHKSRQPRQVFLANILTTIWKLVEISTLICYKKQAFFSIEHTTGTFHSTKNFGKNLQKFPWANGTDFSSRCGKRQAAQFFSLGIFQ